MTLVSKAEAARIAGVSPMSITKAIASGDIVTVGDGYKAKIDVDNPKNAERIALFQDRKKHDPGRGKKKHQEPKPKTKRKPKEQTTVPNQPPPRAPVVRINQGEIDLSDVDGLDRSEIDKIKSLEQTKKIQFERLIKRGDFIERSIVAKFIAGYFDIDLNRQVASAPGLSKNIASYAGIDDAEIILGIEKIIHDEMYEILANKKRFTNRFLLKIKAETIE